MKKPRTERNEELTMKELKWKEQGEKLGALKQHHMREVQRLHEHVEYYQIQVVECQRVYWRLVKNGSHRARIKITVGNIVEQFCDIFFIVEDPNCPTVEGDSSQSQIHSKPQPVMLSFVPYVKHHIRMKETEKDVVTGSGALTTASFPIHSDSNEKQRGGRVSKIFSEQETLESQPKVTKRKHDMHSLGNNIC